MGLKTLAPPGAPFVPAPDEAARREATAEAPLPPGDDTPNVAEKLAKKLGEACETVFAEEVGPPYMREWCSKTGLIRPVMEPDAPEGLVRLGNEWYYEEYTKGAGVNSVGTTGSKPEQDGKAPAAAPADPAAAPPIAVSPEEKKSIFDLFRN